jgi:hypothetical protein
MGISLEEDEAARKKKDERSHMGVGPAAMLGVDRDFKGPTAVYNFFFLFKTCGHVGDEMRPMQPS